MNVLSNMKLTSLKKAIKRFFELREASEAANLQDEVQANLALAKFYDEHLFDKDLADADIYALESYRAAASLGSNLGQFIVSERMLKKAQFWEQQSLDLYGSEIHKRYARLLYEEAFNYLAKATEGDFPPAIRLLGLAHFNGWGIEKNSARGMQLIGESIQKEGRWDKATEILQPLGIDPQQFFSFLAAQQKKES